MFSIPSFQIALCFPFNSVFEFLWFSHFLYYRFFSSPRVFSGPLFQRGSNIHTSHMHEHYPRMGSLFVQPLLENDLL
jgi:hypothetical protein